MGDKQPHLPGMLTQDYVVKALVKALEKNGKHSLYCQWVSDAVTGGYYDRTLPCTCGLDEALALGKEFMDEANKQDA